ncbi:hypothetical protein Q4S45_05545 [Massilia sp. R2A-15]|uniref:hypothetical protein n=1 Tax=Massilia sp. R2A-15 TaxID=3064278 RepID=UPI0027335B07|nr:hypothetical protein [Massilia sp. R2A-15]WLI90583.1 hypothetical protein Q4S45_05545 [Massilia sp. R2A-15]
MPKVALITVHGMGVTLSDYAEPLKARLKHELGDRYLDLTIRPVFYQDLLQDNEAAVWDRVEMTTKVHYDDLRKFLLFGFGDAAGLESRKEDADSVYEMAQREIARALLDVYQQCGSDCHVVFLSQSLGCQVLSNYIYDGQKFRKGLTVDAGIWRDIEHTRNALGGVETAALPFLRAETCMAWVTTGCNIPIFASAHRNITPIEPPNGLPTFRWINFYDPDDVLGWPLRPLSPEYSALVDDRPINSGSGALNWIMKSWNPMAHTTYWTDGDVVKPLAQLLRGLLV